MAMLQPIKAFENCKGADNPAHQQSDWHLFFLQSPDNTQMSRLVGKPTMWFPTRSDTNRPVQSQKIARSLKFWIQVEEELYYPSSENKGADQLRSYCEADLRLSFRIGRLLVFPCGGSNKHFNLYGTSLCFSRFSTNGTISLLNSTKGF